MILCLVAGLAPRAASQNLDRDLPAIQSIEFHGNEHVSSDVLLDQTLLQFPSLRHPLRPRPRFRRNAFDKVLRRIEAYYEREGYPGVDARLDSTASYAGGDAVRLFVGIREGPRALVLEVRFLPQPVFTLAELRAATPLRVGDPFPFNAALRGRATRALRLAFLGRGYLGAAVRDSLLLTPDSTGVRVLYSMTPGPQFTVRAVSITGNIETQQGLIRRELRFTPGEVYSHDRVLESQQNLYSTGLFRSVSILEQDLQVEGRTVDLAVRVSERPMAFVEGSLGAGRRDEFEARATAAWGHRNLFGRGHALEVRSTLAYNLETQGDNYFAEQRVRYTQPHLFGTQIRFAPQVAYTIDDREDDVQLRRLQIDSQSSLKVGRSTNVAGGLSAAFTTTTLSQPNVPEDLLETRSITTSVTRNRSDDLFNPRHGLVQSLTAQRAGFAGDNHFSRLTGAVFHYRPLGRAVLAMGVRAGWVEAFGPSRSVEGAAIGIQGVPFEFLFQGGGSSTIRGFSETSLGPRVTVIRSVTNDLAEVDTLSQQAGTVLAIANLELRAPLPLLGRWNVGAAWFLDAGNVWEDLDALRDAPKGPRFERSYTSLEDVRYGYGFGLRYPTPFGPVRLDLGLPLKRNGRRQFHLGLGHTF
jgi:outer membrane protein insertion porin family